MEHGITMAVQPNNVSAWFFNEIFMRLGQWSARSLGDRPKLKAKCKTKSILDVLTIGETEADSSLNILLDKTSGREFAQVSLKTTFKRITQ